MSAAEPKFFQRVIASGTGRSASAGYFEKKSDLEIWQMFKSGHEGAFRHIYDTHIDMLFRYGCHFTGDRELIKDCIHDLFIQLRQGKKIADTASIKFYLLKAFRWKIQKMVAQRQKFFSFGARPASFSIDVEASYETKLIHAQLDQETLRRLEKALKGLTARQKEALYHFYHQNLGYRQVAQIMELSNVKSARNLIYKALNSLKVYFDRAI